MHIHNCSVTYVSVNQSCKYLLACVFELSTMIRISSSVEWYYFKFTYLYVHTVLTDNDIELLKKECQELDNLLIPACEIKLIIVLGEGMYMH